MARSDYSCASIKSWLSSLGMRHLTVQCAYPERKARRRFLKRFLGPCERYVRASHGIGKNAHWWTFDWVGWCYETAGAYEHFHVDHRLQPNIRATWRAFLTLMSRDRATVETMRAVDLLCSEAFGPYDPTKRHAFILGLWEHLEDKLTHGLNIVAKISHRQECRARRLDMRPMEGFAAKDQSTERLSDEEWLAECLPPKL